jgi:hypothetical protein
MLSPQSSWTFWREGINALPKRILKKWKKVWAYLLDKEEYVVTKKQET